MTLRPVALALLAALSIHVPARALADIVSTGAFDIGLTGGIPPSVSFDGQLRFDTGARTALGVSVNMAADVGNMAFDGDGVVDLAAERLDFELTADSEGEFAFEASGTATCDKVGCLDGRATFAGRLTPDDPDDLLPDDGVYTFDGTAAINVVGQAVNGMFAINAFRPTSTPTGLDVEVTSGPQPFRDTVAGKDRSAEVSALFESVTTAGLTDFLVFSLLPNALPAGVTTDSRVSFFADVSTSAAFGGEVFVCLGYPDEDEDDVVDGTTLSAFRLLVLRAASDDAPFTDVTVSVADGLACGSVPALGRLALGIGPEGGSTSTTVVGGSTTTTLAPGTTTTTNTLLPGETTTTSTSLPGGETTTTSTVSTGESTTTSTTLPSVTTTTVLGAGTTTSTVSATSSTTSSTVRRSTTTTVASGGSTTTTLPVCTAALECLGVAIAGPICPGETVNPKLSTLILKKLAKAQTVLLAARSADSARKVARLVKKARKQVDKVASKASAFVSKPKGAISPECRDRIIAATGLVTQQIDANRI